MHSSLDYSQTVPQVPPSFLQTTPWRDSQQTLGSPALPVPGSCLHATAGGFTWPFSQQVRLNRDVKAELRLLQQHYTILDNRLFVGLLNEEPALGPLLMEAVGPLKNAFGERPIVQIRVQFSDDDSLVKVGVQVPADLGGEPERSLRSFDELWWLKNCHRSGGTLVFDYEIQDAV